MLRTRCRIGSIVLCLQFGDTIFQISNIVNRCLQDSQFMHLSRTSWYHILQNTELLIHLRSSPTLDQAMCRLPRYLSASNASRRWLFFLWRSRSGLTSRRFLSLIVCLFNRDQREGWFTILNSA